LISGNLNENTDNLPAQQRGDVVVTAYAGEYRRPLHPLHAILLAFPFPLFLGALIADWAYTSSFHVQWLNFAAWLNAGGLLVGAFALLWAWIAVFRSSPRWSGRPFAYAIVLLLMWILGFINALTHGKDAWATMPEGLYLSIIATVLALVATWIGYSGIADSALRAEEVK
jgi:uncharacterized membrane protein